MEIEDETNADYIVANAIVVEKKDGTTKTYKVQPKKVKKDGEVSFAITIKVLN